MTGMAIVLGIFIGFSIAFMFVGIIVDKAVNQGDSKGEITDYVRNGVIILEKRDKISKKLRISNII